VIRIKTAAAAVLAVAAGSGAGPAGAAPLAGAGAGAGPTPAGVAAARAALLRRGDFGRGWSQQSPAPAKVPSLTCPRFDPRFLGAGQTGAASSPTFEAGPSGPFASETARVYATTGEQATVWRALVRPGLGRCAAASLRMGGGDGVRFTVTAERTLRLPALPAPAAGYRASGTASLPEQMIDVYLDMFVVGRGGTIAEVVVSSFEQPPARALELRLLRTVDQRMSAD
jgi:hypothetical protein